MDDQNNDLMWRDTEAGRVPISARYDDPYYSLDNGLAETDHVFVAGNDLLRRFDQPLHIAELGFGTGLNFLATVRSWRAAGYQKPLTFTSFECYPLTRDDAEVALLAFPEIKPFSADLLAIWDAAMAGTAAYSDLITLHVVTGDVRETLPIWTGRADAWFLDGFSPAKNPDMWEAPLMQAVADHTKAGGTLATYTAAGHVRRALEEAGFAITRTPGFGRKRHMTRGVLAS
ncbi:MAG: tRNA (5-methylaminomethyl-2-thiouridine)(34)-methyltransferase MnmD [Pseudomonadota bacterium]